jgi:hypothetical protein
VTSVLHVSALGRSGTIEKKLPAYGVNQRIHPESGES